MRDRKLIFFGTDGVRGSIDNEVNPESVLKLGHAAGRHFKKRGINTLVIGKDTEFPDTCWSLPFKLELFHLE